VTEKKLYDSESDNDCNDSDEVIGVGNGYRLWEWGQLQTLISDKCVCNVCGVGLEVIENCEKRVGWCSMIGLKCQLGKVQFIYFELFKIMNCTLPN